MKCLVVALILCVCAPMSVCYAEDDKSETEQIPLIFEIVYGEPATRSLPVLPKAYLYSSEVNITFDEPLPYVDIRVLDAGSGAVVFASAYAYESEVELDLSKNVMTINGKGAPGTVYLLGQMKSGCSATHLI